jgi:hypothetical protein
MLQCRRRWKREAVRKRKEVDKCEESSKPITDEPKM